MNQEVDAEYIKKTTAELNSDFYENYDTGYYLEKATYLLYLLSHQEEYDKGMQKEISVGMLSGVKFDAPMTTSEKERMAKNLKSEICQNYYHALETLFRLFFAHINGTDYPWLDLSAQISFQKFKKEVTEIRIGKIKGVEDTHFKAVVIGTLFGCNEEGNGVIDDKSWTENVDSLINYLAFFASALLESQYFNSYKHGLAIFPKSIGIELEGVFKEDVQESILYLKYNSDPKTTPRFSRSYSYLKWEEKFVLTRVVTCMIENIIRVGKRRFLNSSEAINLNFFRANELDQILTATRKSTGLDTISISL